MKTFVLTIVVILTLMAGYPFLREGFFPIHDTTHVARTYLLEQSLRGGQVPAIWADSLSFGYGYPLFHFYAPLPYYVSLLIRSVLPSYLDAIKATFILATAVGAWGMIRLLKRYGFVPALVGATAFTLLPYKAVDLYVRGALAEVVAFNLLPWVFLVWRDLSSSKKRVAVTVFITSFFLLSHNLIPLITAPFLLLWIIVYQKRHLRAVGVTALLTVLLSAFYLVPLIFERSFVRADEIARHTDYQLHFVEPIQLWSSTWGFGGSAAGIEDGMSFKVGKLHLLLAALGLAVGVIRKKTRKVAILTGFMLVLSLLLSTSISSPVWRALSPLQLVQFPWRYLTLVGFAVSFLAGLAFAFRGHKGLKVGAAALAVIGVVGLNLKYFKPQSSLPVSDSYYLSSEYLATVPSIVPEYQPAWMKEMPLEPPEILVSTTGTVVGLKKDVGRLEVQLDLNEPEKVSLAKAYYPTWQGSVDGESVTVGGDRGGLVSVDVPAGFHTLVLWQGKTYLERVSQLVSLVTFLLLITFIIRKERAHA